MLYVEYKWSKSFGGLKRKRVRVGYTAHFVRGSQGDLARWKIKNLTDEYSPHEFFLVLSWDNLSNLAENSPRSNARLRAAQERHPYMRGNIARRYIERLKGLR